MRLTKIMLLFLISGLFLCCKKKKDYPIPSVPFDMTIDMSLPTYSDLNNVGGWCYVNGGIKGIVVYHQGVNLFVAWERQSPQDPDNTCATPLTSNPDNFLELDDACSGATFSMLDGSPISGSTWGLRGYATSWDGSNLLRIYN